MSDEKSIYQKIKEAGSHSLIYGLGSVLQTVLGFVLIPLYTNYYTTEMYGVLSLVTICGSIAGVVFYLGASSALARSYYDYDDKEERKRVISTSLYLTLGGALIQIVLGCVLGEYISVWLFDTTAYKLHIALIFLSSAITFINNLFYMLLRFERKSKQVVILNICSLVLSSLLIVSLLVWLHLGILAPIMGLMLSQLVICIALFLLQSKNLVLGYSSKELKLQLKFGLQVVMSSLAFYAFDFQSRYFINKYCSLSDLGIYSLGNQIGMSINMLLIFPFCQIWAPMKMQYRNDRNADDMYKKVLTYYFMVGLAITVFLSLFAREIITVMAGRIEYVDAYRVVPFIMFGMLIYGAVNIIDNGIYFSRKMIYHAYIFWFTSLISLCLNFLFVPLFGYLAAAVVIFISYLTVVILVFVISDRLYKIPYEGKRLVALMSLSIVVIVAGGISSFSSVFLVVIFKLSLFSLMGLVVFTFILHKAEKNKLVSIVRFILTKTTLQKS